MAQKHLLTAQQFKIQQNDINKSCSAFKNNALDEKASKSVPTKWNKRALSEVSDFYSMNFCPNHYITKMALEGGIRVELQGCDWYQINQWVKLHHISHFPAMQILFSIY